MKKKLQMEKNKYCFICRKRIRRWHRKFGPVHARCLKRRFDEGRVQFTVFEKYAAMSVPDGATREYLH